MDNDEKDDGGLNWRQRLVAWVATRLGVRLDEEWTHFAQPRPRHPDWGKTLPYGNKSSGIPMDDWPTFVAGDDESYRQAVDAWQEVEKAWDGRLRDPDQARKDAGRPYYGWSRGGT